MTVVSNTSPVSNLAIIGRLELLREQFSSVLLPEAVRRELAALGHARAEAAIRQGLADKWLQVAPVLNPLVVRIFEQRLDAGEAEAIALALERSADLLLIDEADGREVAGAAGLRLRGALGVLRKARQMGRIPSLRDDIRRLRTEAHFFVAAALEDELLKAVGES